MWTQKRNLVILVSILLFLVVLATAYLVYQKWQADKRNAAARIERETVLKDLITIPYTENRTPQDIKKIKNSLLDTRGNKAPTLTEVEKKEVMDTLLSAPRTLSE
ncbi:MAG: hypothetical protein ACKOW9_01250 [Candidatus Paceibacterota bacterium]